MNLLRVSPFSNAQQQLNCFSKNQRDMQTIINKDKSSCELPPSQNATKKPCQDLHRTRKSDVVPTCARIGHSDVKCCLNSCDIYGFPPTLAFGSDLHIPIHTRTNVVRTSRIDIVQRASRSCSRYQMPSSQ